MIKQLVAFGTIFVSFLGMMMGKTRSKKKERKKEKNIIEKKTKRQLSPSPSLLLRQRLIRTID